MVECGVLMESMKLSEANQAEQMESKDLMEFVSGWAEMGALRS